FVDQARRAGASWTEIGQAMGVTKQAAQKRFVAKATTESELFAGGRFERFTPRARHVVVAAQEHAIQLRNKAVGTEHIVLGLLEEPDAVAARAIVAQGVSLDDVRAAVTAAVGPPRDDLPDHIPFAPETKKLLELAVREALRLGHNYIGTEHILLGLLSDSTSTVGRVAAGMIR